MMNIINNIGHINIFEDIGNLFGEGYSFDKFKEEVAKIEGDITINIKSYGGDLHEALAIYDYIKALPNKIITNIIGSTASAATIISLAGDERYITPNSRYLIHKPMVEGSGNSDDFEKIIKNLKNLDSHIVDLYSKETNLNSEEILMLMEENKWISSEEAITMGFCHGLVKKNTDMKNDIKNEVNEEKDNKMPLNEEKDNKSTNGEPEIDVKEKINQLEGHVGQLTKKVAELEEENEELKTQLKEKEITEAEQMVEEINTYLNQMVTENKIESDSVETWKEIALNNNLTKVKNLIGSIPKPQTSNFKNQLTPRPQNKLSKNDYFKMWKNKEITGEDYLNLIK